MFAGLHGEVTSVSGRRTVGGVRGLPMLDQLTIKQQDGTVLKFGMSPTVPEAPLDLVAPLLAQSFMTCPICMTARPSQEEHVSQGDLGGLTMTMTYPACNDDLGSKVEAELQHWFDRAMVDVAFEHEDVPGARRARRLLYREGPDGFGILMDPSRIPSSGR